MFEDSSDITSEVSDYAQTFPLEFVAQCYSQMRDGIKLDDIMELYKKPGGVIIKNIFMIVF